MTPLVRRLGRAAFYLASALVGALSLAPSAALPPVSIGDKVEHVIAYGALALLGGATSERGILRTILGLVAFGFLLELLQAFSPGRSPDAADVIADIVGACIGGGAAAALRRATPIAIDKLADDATLCRPCVAGGDGSSASCAPAARPASSHKRVSCASN